MKVGTDGVLIGAWAACEMASQILDIGTGTGLIALICAQKSKAQITGIEINPQASSQAFENKSASLFDKQIEIICTSLQDFIKSTTQKFDYIISNPPYFEINKKTNVDKRAIARQQSTLEFKEIFEASKQLLLPHGRLALIFPYQCLSTIDELIKLNGFSYSRISYVYPNAKKPCKRILIEASLSAVEQLQISRMHIEESGRHQYSNAYKLLTKDLYL